MPKLYDITAPIYPGMPSFPNDPEVEVAVDHSLAKGDAYNLSRLAVGTHVGTHVDPPRHFLADGATADQMDLNVLCGPCRVVRIPDTHTSIGTGDLHGLLHGVTRVLFRTRNSARWARGEGYFPDYVALSPEAAEYLVPAGVQLVGIDSQSVELDPTGQYPVHHSLLSSGCLILEGLRLADVPPGEYTLWCLPMKLRGGDGAPCRAVLVGP